MLATHLCEGNRSRLTLRRAARMRATAPHRNLFLVNGGGWGSFRESVLSECMVRRRVASEKQKMAVGLRQCIRPLVESTTPGHDGYPLALVRIMWTVS